MSDLSLPRGASNSSAAGVLNGLRPNGGSTPPGASGESPSFSAVLRDKAQAANAADTAAKAAAKTDTKAAEKAERPREREEVAADGPVKRTDHEAAPTKIAKSEKRQDSQDETNSTGPVPESTVAQDASTATPIAAVMIQLTPAALVAAATQEAAGEISRHGAIVRELARGHGQVDKDSPGNRGLALAVGQSLSEDASVGGVIAPPGSISGQGAGASDGQTAPGSDAQAQSPVELAVHDSAPDIIGNTTPDTSAVAATVSTAEDSELSSSSGPVAASSQESDFTQALSRARDGQTIGAVPENSSQTARSDASLPMRAQVGHPNWSNELGDKMTWMVTQQKQHADLVLNPPQLGRIEVSLTISGDQASATFTSPNAAVREMLENSLPRLREILAGSGLNLGQADVGAQSFAQQQQLAQENQRTAALARNAPAEVTLDAPLPLGGTLNLGRTGERSGVVDVFA